MEAVISEYAKKKLAHRPDILTHTERVVNYCHMIADTEDAQNDILTMSAWLHDICWSEIELTSENLAMHPQKSAEMAKNILKTINMSDKVITKVSSTIADHETLPENPTIETRILFEADHLDRLGAIGVSKILSTWGIKDGLSIINTEILPKMETWFTTKKGFELARDKITFLNLFADNYNKEIIESNKS